MQNVADVQDNAQSSLLAFVCKPVSSDFREVSFVVIYDCWINIFSFTWLHHILVWRVSNHKRKSHVSLG